MEINNFLLSNNNFPKIGLLSLDCSGEYLLRYYLEKVFSLSSFTNIRNYSTNDLFKDTFNNTETNNIDLLEKSWFIYSDFPIQDININELSKKINVSNNLIDVPLLSINSKLKNIKKLNNQINCKFDDKNEDYTKSYIDCNISLGILLIRNPIDLIISRIVDSALKHNYRSKQNNKEDYVINNDKNKIIHNKNNNSCTVYDTINIEKIYMIIEEWKIFVNYWIESPIPLLIIRYEDLLNNPCEEIIKISKFILGTNTIKNTFIEKTIYNYFNIEKEELNNNSLNIENLDFNINDSLASNCKKNACIKLDSIYIEKSYNIEDINIIISNNKDIFNSPKKKNTKDKNVNKSILKKINKNNSIVNFNINNTDKESYDMFNNNPEVNIFEIKELSFKLKRAFKDCLNDILNQFNYGDYDSQWIKNFNLINLNEVIGMFNSNLTISSNTNVYNILNIGSDSRIFN